MFTTSQNLLDEVIEFQNAICGLPLALRISYKDGNKLKYEMVRETTADLYALKEDEEGGPNYFHEDQTVARSIDQEDLVDYVINILTKVHNINLVPALNHIFEGSKIIARIKDNDVILDITLFFYYLLL